MECSVVVPNGLRNVILHAFDWRYQDVAQRAKEIRQLGYGSVLVSPPMCSLTTSKGTPWWQRYQPRDYRIIDNQLGNTHDFRAMVNALAEENVWVYADIVFNHMANESKQRSDLQYPSAAQLATYASDPKWYESLRLFGDLTQPLFHEDDFSAPFGIKNWRDTWQVQNGRITGGPDDPGLPKLRANEHVIQQQRRLLTALKDIGVKGFRIDAAKHMTLEHIKRVWSDDLIQDMHIFGEIITDGGATEEEYQLFLEPYLKETRLDAYDFPLFTTIFQAFSAGGSLKSLINPYCFGQALSCRRAITFVITHDIPNNAVFRDQIMEPQSEWLAYAYILGRDGGVPLIYTDLNTSGILDAQGQPRWQNVWNDPRMAHMIAFHNHTHGEGMRVLEANDDILLFARGEKGIVAINKSSRTLQVTVSSADTRRELLTQTEYIPNTNGLITLNIGAKSALMLI